MPVGYRFSEYMIEPALMATRPVGVTPKPTPVAVNLSPPVYQEKEDPPYALIAAGVLAVGVAGFIAWKKLRKKR